jgi:hypothetical protein
LASLPSNLPVNNPVIEQSGSTAVEELGSS